MPTNTEKQQGSRKTYLEEVKIELKKFHWPSKQELSDHTITVIIMVLVTGFFIYAIDASVGAVVEKLIGIN